MRNIRKIDTYIKQYEDKINDLAPDLKSIDSFSPLYAYVTFKSKTSLIKALFK